MLNIPLIVLGLIGLWACVQEKNGKVDRKKEEKVFYTTFKIMITILSIICFPITILLGACGMDTIFKQKK